MTWKNWFLAFTFRLNQNRHTNPMQSTIKSITRIEYQNLWPLVTSLRPISAKGSKQQCSIKNSMVKTIFRYNGLDRQVAKFDSKLLLVQMKLTNMVLLSRLIWLILDWFSYSLTQRSRLVNLKQEEPYSSVSSVSTRSKVTIVHGLENGRSLS